MLLFIQEQAIAFLTISSLAESSKARDEWYIKYRLLESVPFFIKRGEVDVVNAAASCVDHGTSCRHVSIKGGVMHVGGVAALCSHRSLLCAHFSVERGGVGIGVADVSCIYIINLLHTFVSKILIASDWQCCPNAIHLLPSSSVPNFFRRNSFTILLAEISSFPTAT